MIHMLRKKRQVFRLTQPIGLCCIHAYRTTTQINYKFRSCQLHKKDQINNSIRVSQYALHQAAMPT